MLEFGNEKCMKVRCMKDMHLKTTTNMQKSPWMLIKGGIFQIVQMGENQCVVAIPLYNETATHPGTATSCIE